jgi:hypothetical protein
MHELSFDEAVRKSIDIIRSMEQPQLAPAVIGATLSYLLHTHYAEEAQERIFQFIIDDTRDYLRLRRAQEKQEAGNA